MGTDCATAKPHDSQGWLTHAPDKLPFRPKLLLVFPREVCRRLKNAPDGGRGHDFHAASAVWHAFGKDIGGLPPQTGDTNAIETILETSKI